MQPEAKTRLERQADLINKFKGEIGDELRLTRAEMWEYLGAFCGLLIAANMREVSIHEALSEQGHQNSGRILLRIETILNDDHPPEPGPSYGSLAT